MGADDLAVSASVSAAASPSGFCVGKCWSPMQQVNNTVINQTLPCTCCFSILLKKPKNPPQLYNPIGEVFLGFQP